MFGKLVAIISVLALALMCAGGVTAEGTGASPAAGILSPVGTAFTYQGQLQSGGAPVNDSCDFQFSLWDAAGSGTPPTGGNQIGSQQQAPSIPVSNGLFAVRLDFGSGAFTGEACWLQTAVRCPAGSGTYTTLAPRQALTPVPYALFSQDLSLPFQKGVNSPDTVFSIQNDGTGSAGRFKIDNPLNDSTALRASTNGSSNAIESRNTGTGRAGDFLIQNPLNTSSALSASTNGSGDAINSRNTGTGRAASFQIENPANGNFVLSASTNGTGTGGMFTINNPANNSPALQATTNGTNSAGDFKISNATSHASALKAETGGSGDAISSRNTGSGRAASFQIENPANGNIVLSAYTNGTGTSGMFTINNPANNSPALQATTNGTGGAFDAHSEGSGAALNAYTMGTGMAGNFGIGNPANSSQALNAFTNGGGPAINAFTNGTGWAGRFEATGSGDGVYITVPAGNAGLNVASGTKNAVVATSEGARLLYTEESTEVWFSDYGFGRLTDGSVFIAIDPVFAETVNLDEPYHVFVEPYGDAELYVSQRTPAGFEVRLRGGDPGVEFSYRLVAARRGYEGQRLERAPWADDDPNLYPAQPAASQGGGAR